MNMNKNYEPYKTILHYEKKVLTFAQTRAQLRFSMLVLKRNVTFLTLHLHLQNTAHDI